MQETQVQSLVGKIPWRREWQPTPVFLPGEFHEWKSVVGYSPWSCKQSDMTERLTPYPPLSHFFIFVHSFCIFTHNVDRVNTHAHII